MSLIQQVVTSFGELALALDQIADQQIGVAGMVSNIGEPYVEFLSKGYARPRDEKFIERFVAQDMAWQINRYCADKNGTIYWRVRLETDIEPHAIVLHYSNDGPDVDETLNLRCVKDRNWIRVAAYCRFVRAKMPVLLREQKAA